MFAVDAEYQTEFCGLLVKTLGVCRELDCVVWFLFHVDASAKDYIEMRMLEKLIHVFTLLQKSDGMLGLLLENPTASPNFLSNSGYDFVLENTSPTFVRACFDLCHYRISRRLYWGHYTYKWGACVHSVHFSECGECDGLFKDGTHVVRHTSVWSVLRDLAELGNLGIDLTHVLVVPEICEEDYVSRPEEVAELQMLCAVEQSLPSLELLGKDFVGGFYAQRALHMKASRTMPLQTNFALTETGENIRYSYGKVGERM